MCGIIVICYKKQEPVNEKILVKMRDILTQRGTDGAGIWISPDR